VKKNRPIRVLVTGGPTRAYLDDVRFLSNVSTGELARQICEKFKRRKVEVAAVIGPTPLDFESLKLKKLVRVETAEEMQRAVLKLCEDFKPDAAVFSAAVLDFAPEKKVTGKVTSQKQTWVIRLHPTPKILDEVGNRYPSIRRIGFKLETSRRMGRARERFARTYLIEKGLEGLCLNYLSEVKGAKHLAYLFEPGIPPKTAHSKAEIANWIVKRLS